MTKPNYNLGGLVRINPRVWIALFLMSLLNGPLLILLMLSTKFIMKTSNNPLYMVFEILGLLAYITSVCTLKKWYLIVGPLFLFPVIVYVSIYAAFAGACAVFNECL